MRLPREAGTHLVIRVALVHGAGGCKGREGKKSCKKEAAFHEVPEMDTRLQGMTGFCDMRVTY